MRKALTIAGTDPSGGAGLHADLKTFAALDVYGMGAVTAVVAQNTRGVVCVEHVSPAMIRAQIDAVLSDILPDAAKVGMAGTAASISAIAASLGHRPSFPLVVDPVMVSTSGHRLLAEEAEEALIRDILPLASVITPNIPEAEVLARRAGWRDALIESKDDMERAACAIASLTGAVIILKGGHRAQDADDLLFLNGVPTWLSGHRVDTPHTHGTGCTLSAALAAYLARGLSVIEAARAAKDYLTGALSTGLALGGGRGPVDHGWMSRRQF